MSSTTEAAPGLLLLTKESSPKVYDSDPKVREAALVARAGALGRQWATVRQAARAVLVTRVPNIDNAMAHWCKAGEAIEKCELGHAPYAHATVMLTQPGGKDAFLARMEEMCPANTCRRRSISFADKKPVVTLRYSGLPTDDDQTGFKPPRGAASRHQQACGSFRNFNQQLEC